MNNGLRLPGNITACLFDLDGVLTHTAELHAAAWKLTFDDFLRRRAMPATPVPFDAVVDYDIYVDGKPRAAGVRSFLASRGIELAEGSPGQPTNRNRGAQRRASTMRLPGRLAFR